MSWTTPPVTNVGDIATSQFNNLYVKDNTLFLRGDLAWTAPTLATHWTGYSGGGSWSAAGYRKIADLVVTRGIVTPTATGAVTPGTVLFTYNLGYRPLGDMPFACAMSAGIAHVDVLSTGDVVYQGPAVGTALAATTGDYVEFGQISFSTL